MGKLPGGCQRTVISTFRRRSSSIQRPALAGSAARGEAQLIMRARILGRLACLIAGATCAFADQSIYTNSLVNGWENWSWATVNLAATSPVHSADKSISVSPAAWQALYVHHAAFDSGAYTHLN